MRLKKIKLGGFKSFVDPTTINLPSNLVGIVGPNGCGKSNVIDAVRWVMGESSAKTLRGDSMADVIFNGSSSRKPVGHAFVELIFDNGDGTIGGQYANYAEISIKRQVSRDGQSTYFLNGAKCRRKDITDIFLGTGLGARSYAIIEQGMISRLIEAKPEDLRVFLEEAAGISKYKERRRETETRIRHTKENLDRLNDLRDEVAKQLQHLQRQARTAERYKELKQEERQTKAELYALRWKGLEDAANRQELSIREMETAVEAALADQRSSEARLVQLRESHNDANDVFNRVQANYYAVGSEIARLEQSIEHARDIHRKQQAELDQLEQDQREANRHVESDRERLGSLQEQLEALTPDLEERQQIERETAEVLQEAEQAINDWHGSWNLFNDEATQPARAAEVERTRIEQLEKQTVELDQRLQRTRSELVQLGGMAELEEIQQLEEQLIGLEAAVATGNEALSQARADIEQLRSEQHETESELDQARSELQAMRGRAASLDALQQAALGKTQSGLVSQWLERNQLGRQKRLAEQLNVESGWESAVEVVLGSHLEAVCVDSIDSLGEALAQLAGGPLGLVESAEPAGRSGTGRRALADAVQGAAPLAGLLDRVWMAESLQQALAERRNLGAGESLITREGVWLGRNWLRVANLKDDKAGLLSREQEIKQLTANIQHRQGAINLLEERLTTLRNRVKETEEQRDRKQGEHNQHSRQLAEVRAKAANLKQRVEDQRRRQAQLEQEAADTEQRILQLNQEVQQSRTRLQESLDAMADFESRRGEMIRRRDELRTQVDEARGRHRVARDEVHRVALQLESARTAQRSLNQGLERTEGQLAQLQRRREQLTSSLSEGDQPITGLNDQLEEKLKNRIAVETELAEARGRVEALDEETRQLEQRRGEHEQRTQERRSSLDQARMSWQELKTRRDTVRESLVETEHEPEAVLAGLEGQEATESVWQEKVDQVTQRIQRLGAINLAAIDEFAEQSERMEYLDRQLADLNESLQTLENAIQKIDRETRTRFKETFDKVNTSFQTGFPRLFGGGHAYLQFTSNDLLETGVAVMARPPGKRNTTIHLLSGGEKALTAVALVFAIFQLNPAPFCMLDEVDAPLDEANVGRFCTMVKEMAEKVQFVFITHNKTTMEMSSQLMGVTMHEPGVSRLVAVDVDEALEMAATG